MKMIGKQVTLDLYHCDEDLLQDKQALQDILSTAMQLGSMPVLDTYTHADAYPDFSIILLCQSGHVSMHSYPALGFIAIDILAGTDGANPEKVAWSIKNALNPEKSKMTSLQRGDFGTISDMKPRKKTHIKAMRRIKNTSAKMLSLLGKKQKQ